MSILNDAILGAQNSTYTFLDNGKLLIFDAVIHPFTNNGDKTALMFRNFAGRKNAFGNSDRTFNIIIAGEIAERLSHDGWNIKAYELNDGMILYMTEIVVNLDSTWPPPILLREYNPDGTFTDIRVDKENIAMLDSMSFEKCDILINPNVGMDGFHKKGYLNDLRLVKANNSFDYFQGRGW